MSGAPRIGRGGCESRGQMAAAAGTPETWGLLRRRLNLPASSPPGINTVDAAGCKAVGLPASLHRHQRLGYQRNNLLPSPAAGGYGLHGLGGQLRGWGCECAGVGGRVGGIPRKWRISPERDFTPRWAQAYCQIGTAKVQDN